jgi:hypothetical protein
LNKGNYLKFGQKTEQKQLKLCSVNKNREKNCSARSQNAAQGLPGARADLCGG